MTGFGFIEVSLSKDRHFTQPTLTQPIIIALPMDFGDNPTPYEIVFTFA